MSQTRNFAGPDFLQNFQKFAKILRAGARRNFRKNAQKSPPSLTYTSTESENFPHFLTHFSGRRKFPGNFRREFPGNPVTPPPGTRGVSVCRLRFSGNFSGIFPKFRKIRPGNFSGNSGKSGPKMQILRPEKNIYSSGSAKNTPNFPGVRGGKFREIPGNSGKFRIFRIL